MDALKKGMRDCSMAYKNVVVRHKTRAEELEMARLNPW